MVYSGKSVGLWVFFYQNRSLMLGLIVQYVHHVLDPEIMVLQRLVAGSVCQLDAFANAWHKISFMVLLIPDLVNDPPSEISSALSVAPLFEQCCRRHAMHRTMKTGSSTY